MLSLTLNHKNKIRNEFLDSIMYRKVVLHMILILSLDKLKLLVILIIIVLILLFYYYDYRCHCHCHCHCHSHWHCHCYCYCYAITITIVLIATVIVTVINIARVVFHVARSDTPQHYLSCVAPGPQWHRQRHVHWVHTHAVPVDTHAVPVVISNGLLGIFTSHCTWLPPSPPSAACSYGMHIHIFNKVAVRKNYECQKYEKNHRFMRMRKRT